MWERESVSSNFFTSDWWAICARRVNGLYVLQLVFTTQDVLLERGSVKKPTRWSRSRDEEPQTCGSSRGCACEHKKSTLFLMTVFWLLVSWLWAVRVPWRGLEKLLQDPKRIIWFQKKKRKRNTIWSDLLFLVDLCVLIKETSHFTKNIFVFFFFQYFAVDH